MFDFSMNNKQSYSKSATSHQVHHHHMCKYVVSHKVYHYPRPKGVISHKVYCYHMCKQ